MKVADPLHRGPDNKLADRGAVLAVIVDAVSPGRAVAGAEVGREFPEVISLRSEVIENDVQANGHVRPVRGINESLQSNRAAVTLVHGVGQDAVVAPVAVAGERLDRHQLHAGDAQLRKLRQVGSRGVQRSLFGESADVKLVEYQRFEVDALPAFFPPSKGLRIKDRGSGVHSFGLTQRRGIGSDPAVLELVRVSRSVGPLGTEEREASLAFRVHWEASTIEQQRKRAMPGCPHPEGGASVRDFDAVFHGKPYGATG